MNYIYDIVLNFQDNYYNFFEWKRDDKIRNIPKISLYKVTDEDIINLKYNKVKVTEEFINRIKEDNKKYKKIMCLVSNGKIALGLLFNNDGTLYQRSSLIFEEEDEVVDSVKHLPTTPITYLINIPTKYQDKLRIEKEKKTLTIDYITNTNDIITLKYLYYEYYEKEINDINLIKNSLLNELTKEWNIKQNNLYNIINLLTKVKQR